MVISCSRAVGDQFESRNGSGRHTLIYPGVEPRRREGQRDRFRRGYGIPDDALCLAVVGNISRGRGQDVAIRAVSLLRARRRDVRCLVVGSPHDRKVDRRYQAELERLVDDLALHGVVSFTGFVDRVDDVYAAADVVVNPARFDEPFGRVALEALAAGRPVVATRVGGIPEALRDGVDALLVEPDDPEAIAAAIERIAGDPGLGRKLVEQGRDRALREFSERAAVDAFERVVSSLLADPPGRAGVRARAAQ